MTQDIDAKLATTRIRATFTVEPVGNIVGDVAGLWGDSLLQLLQMFYPAPVCKKTNVVVTELVTNVLENIAFPESGMKLDVSVDGAVLAIEVSNRVTPDQYASVQARLDRLGTSEEARKLLAQTIKERRVARAKGGLGFMRLVSENKFKVSARYTDGILKVLAEYSLKDRP